MEPILYHILYAVHIPLLEHEEKYLYIYEPSETSDQVSLRRLGSNAYFDDVVYLTDTNPEGVESISGFSAKLTGTV